MVKKTYEPVHIPKDFVSGIRIPWGPLEGALAKPCFCGRPFEEGEEAVLIGNGVEFYMVHKEHAPAGIIDGDNA